MRKSLFILMLLLVYLLFSSKSCSSDEKDVADRQEADLMKVKKSLKDEFESEKLSRKSLNAFEVKAEQKLVDLADYLQIYSDNKMNEAFKGQARQMILGLFISDSVKISSVLSDEKEGNSLPLTKFLHIDEGSNDLSIDFKFDSIEIIKPLHRTGEFNYAGSLAFTRRIISYSSSDTLFFSPVKMDVDIIAAKINKTFGKDTLRVWEVFLGEIR
jgi:hypothetical protein